MSLNQAKEVVIIGAGVIGCSIAYQLSKAGIKVSVLERDEIAAEASRAAAGLISPGEVLTEPKAVADLFLASWSMTAGVIEEIEAASGVQVEYFQTGALHVLKDVGDQTALRSYARIWQEQGSDVQWLNGDQISQYEPLLDQSFDIALYVSDTVSIRPRLMTRAFAEAARKYGANFLEHTEVTGLRQQSDKVTGVETAQGQTIACDCIVIAAGPWSQQAGSWLGLNVPVFPARGQILSLRQPEMPLKHTIIGNGIYIVPKIDHTIYVGATIERAGFDKSNTAGGIANLLSSAIQLVPELEHATIVDMWSGLRPWSQDSYPILGKAPGWENVVLATGHGPGGFELSAITGKTIAELITSGQTPALIRPFGLERFTGKGQTFDFT
jgi:glycine oxidase